VIYVDNNATTRLAPEVAACLTDAYQQGLVNPASQHRLGQKSRRQLDDARESIIELLGGRAQQFDGDRLIFTSGGTESNNLVLQGLEPERPGQIIISAVEHPSLLEAAQHLAVRNHCVKYLPVDRHGVVDLNILSDWLQQPTRLVSVMLANNETGVLQPIPQVSEICRQHAVPLHVDAVQAVGKIPFSFHELGVDAMTITPHKYHGPRGIGGLLLNSSIQLNPMLHGGAQQLALRPGTESVELALGFERATQIAIENLSDTQNHLIALRDQLEEKLGERFDEREMHINGQSTARLPNTSNLAFPGVDRQALIIALDMAGVACSTGSACASGSSEPSQTLLAMGCSADVVSSAIRISFGRDNATSDVQALADRIFNTINRLRQQ